MKKLVNKIGREKRTLAKRIIVTGQTATNIFVTQHQRGVHSCSNYIRLVALIRLNIRRFTSFIVSTFII